MKGLFIMEKTYEQILGSVMENACMLGSLDWIKKHIESNYNIHYNSDALIRAAARNGKLEIAKYLIENGADIHAQNEYPLIMACNAGNVEMVNLLIDSGADIRIQNDEPLKVAVESNHLEIVKILLDHGSLPNMDIALAGINRGYDDIILYFINWIVGAHT